MSKVRAILISPQTGERVGEIGEGDKITRKKSLDYLNDVADLKDTIEWDSESFFKGHTDEIILLIKDLSIHEKAFLLSIVPYIAYESCHLRYNNGKDIGTEDLVTITQMSRSTTYETIQKLINKDVLCKAKNSKGRQYYINPWIFNKGNRINIVLRTMFKNYKIRTKNNIKWGDAES